MFAFNFTLLVIHLSKMEANDEIAFGSSNNGSRDFNLNNIVLKSSMRHCSGLRICHFNSASIFPKIEELRTIFDGVNFDVIGVTESWLKPYHTSKSIALKGFNSFRNDRVSRGGGILIYVKDNICVSIIKQSHCTKTEYLFLELRYSGVKVLFCCLYNSHSSNDISLFLNELNVVCPQYSNIILTGDFNLDLLDPAKFRFITSSLFTAGLEIFPRTEPTRFPSDVNGCSPSLLDYFALSDLNKIGLYGQISCPGISDHDMIYTSYKLHRSEAADTTFYYRDYRSLNLNNAIAKLYELPWNNIFWTQDIDEKVQCFNNNFQKLYDEFIPLKRVKKKSDLPVWFNNNIAKAIDDRNIAHAIFRRNNSIPNQQNFRRLRNKVNLLIRCAKKNFWEVKLSANQPPKKLWKNLSRLGLANEQAHQCDLFSADELNEAFSLNQNHSFQFHNDLQYCIRDPNNSFSFHNESQETIHKAIHSVKSEAGGIDGISAKFLKLVLVHLIGFIEHIFNCCLTTSTFPAAWKWSKLIPIPKKSSPQLGDFRPISILSFLSKALEKLMFEQIASYINCHKLFVNEQSGFRPNHSTSSALLKVTNDLHLACDGGKINFLLLLDFSKAFDRVSFLTLLKKLEVYFNFSSSALLLLHNYLYHRNQKVFFNGKWSSPKSTTSGVPQGSILGPLLFLLFINDLPLNIDSNCHLFADDVQIYRSCEISGTAACISSLNKDVKQVVEWSSKNGISINASKSQSIVITRRQIVRDSLPKVKVNGDEISYVPKIRNLGIIFNEKLTWNDHVDEMCKKISFGLRKLWTCSHFTPTEIRRRLILALILPLFTYGDVVFSLSLNSACQHRLNVLFNSCASYVFGIKRYEHISSFSPRIIGCSLQQYYKIRVCSFIYRLIKTCCPSYLYNQLKFSMSARTRHLIIPRSRFSLMNSSFFVKAIITWNLLPLTVRNASSTVKFKVLCKQ